MGQGAPLERVRGGECRDSTVRSSLGRWTAFRKMGRRGDGESPRGVCAEINVANLRTGEFPRGGGGGSKMTTDRTRKASVDYPEDDSAGRGNG